jgi:hypothetical protein
MIQQIRVVSDVESKESTARFAILTEPAFNKFVPSIWFDDRANFLETDHDVRNIISIQKILDTHLEIKKTSIINIYKNHSNIHINIHLQNNLIQLRVPILVIKTLKEATLKSISKSEILILKFIN